MKIGTEQYRYVPTLFNEKNHRNNIILIMTVDYNKIQTFTFADILFHKMFLI